VNVSGSQIDIIDGAGADAGEVKAGIIASRFNQAIVERLLDGCLSTLQHGGIAADAVTLVRVAGAFEIPVAVKALIEHADIDVVIALGAIIRGETSHFDFIAAECARGIAGIAVRTGVPVIFGVLTVDNVDQALARSGLDARNKGTESALAAIDVVSVLRQIRSRQGG